ncbi:MAG: DUF262 domain-containing protein [Eubacteriales bacterium]|nr:DUF262 domain-containing protein [Eubacteriales bacterium]
MSKLNVDQKTIKDLFQDKKSDFLIPDYQRPYAWGETECLTLWEDIFSFAFPNYDCSRFDSDNDEYFLGPIVIFKNENKKLEIIDGQQRLTTLMLLLRAFYSKFDNMRDENSQKTREIIERCIWKTDEFDKPKKSELKIDSEVATDNDKEVFLEILKNGTSKNDNKSRYAQNYHFFQEKITEFLCKYPGYFSYLPVRILNNCILLPIEADNQDTALRIFSTLNDRGKPLSDADIFKAQFYKYYKSINLKDEFIEKWKGLEDLCDSLFPNSSGTPMDELFTRYMYFERAKRGISTSTTEALRKFYEKDSYQLLKNQTTLENLIGLADFWKDVSAQDDMRFSDKVLRQLYILNYAPNSMWTYFVSVYYLQNRDADGKLNDDSFYCFLQKVVSFVLAYAITNPGVNALRSPIYSEMLNIVNGQPVTFEKYKFDETTVRSLFNTCDFSNIRPLTKSMLVWWMFQNENQCLVSLDTSIEIEHIFAKNRQNKEQSLSDAKKLEQIGNKAILEQRINIRASDYRFIDKIKYYRGFTNGRNKPKEGTKNAELLDLSNTQSDFTESDIDNRSKIILDAFIDFIKQNGLM